LICKPAASGIFQALFTQQLTQIDVLKFLLDFLIQLLANTIAHRVNVHFFRMGIYRLNGCKNVCQADFL
jgi:hypothetical protein